MSMGKPEFINHLASLFEKHAHEMLLSIHPCNFGILGNLDIETLKDKSSNNDPRIVPSLLIALDLLDKCRFRNLERITRRRITTTRFRVGTENVVARSPRETRELRKKEFCDLDETRRILWFENSNLCRHSLTIKVNLRLNLQDRSRTPLPPTLWRLVRRDDVSLRVSRVFTSNQHVDDGLVDGVLNGDNSVKFRSLFAGSEFNYWNLTEGHLKRPIFVLGYLALEP